MSVRRVVALAVFVMQAAAAVRAQTGASRSAEGAALSVETLGVEPTVVKSGDTLTATYRVRFRDLIPAGREVVVLEDRTVPENLPVAPFEATGLQTLKRRVGEENVWDLRYRLRIIKPSKGNVAVPGFNVFWLVRDLGQPIDKAPVLQALTTPLAVRYVTTISDEPLLDIRDEIDLGRFGGRVAALEVLTWVVAPLPLVAWAVLLVRGVRRTRGRRGARPRATVPEPPIPEPPTPRQARRDLRATLDAIRLQPLSSNGGLRDAQRSLVVACRDYLRAEVPELEPGDTARDITRRLEGELQAGPRRETLAALAERVLILQTTLEQGVGASVDPVDEAARIEELVRRLDRRVQVRERVRNWLTRT